MNKTTILIATFLIFQNVCAQTGQLSDLLKNNNYTELQMQKFATGHHAISSVINDNKGLFVVDTGAITIINNSLLGKYQLEKVRMLKSIEGAGAGGPFVADQYPIKNLILNGFDTKLNKLVTTDLNAVSNGLFNANGKLIDGVIGQDVLLANQAIIDFKTNKLYLKPPVVNNANQSQQLTLNLDSIQKSLNYKSIDLGTLSFEEFNLVFLTVDIEINGNKGLLIVDSGAGRSMLHNKHFKKFALNTNKTSNYQSSSGAGGAFTINKIELPELNIKHLNLGSLNFHSADLSALVDFINLKTGITIDGVLGQDTLTLHNSVINVADKKLYLKIKP